jgi:DNA invertase Pin-like site-specific DNA recombinase
VNEVTVRKTWNSTGGQTVENQRRDLEAAALQRGWVVTATYDDAGISGAKGRDMRPGLDAMRGKFDVAMVWAVDRLGRSLHDLIDTMKTLHGAKVNMFLPQQRRPALVAVAAFGCVVMGRLVIGSQVLSARP